MDAVGSRARARAEILAFAASFLADEPKAQMSRIASAAGVSRATLYRHFRSREDLMRELQTTAVDEAGARLAAAGLDRVDIREGISRTTRALVEVAERFRVLLRTNSFPPQNELQAKVIAPIFDLLARGRREGSLRDDVPIEVLADSLLRLVAGATYAGSVSQHGREDVAAWAASLFLDGAAPLSPPE